MREGKGRKDGRGGKEGGRRLVGKSAGRAVVGKKVSDPTHDGDDGDSGNETGGGRAAAAAASRSGGGGNLVRSSVEAVCLLLAVRPQGVTARSSNRRPSLPYFVAHSAAKTKLSGSDLHTLLDFFCKTVIEFHSFCGAFLLLYR